MTHLSLNFPSRYSLMYAFPIAEKNTEKMINSIKQCTRLFHINTEQTIKFQNTKSDPRHGSERSKGGQLNLLEPEAEHGNEKGDHSVGDMVCFECGLTLESHSINKTSKWRTSCDYHPTFKRQEPLDVLEKEKEKRKG